MGFFCFLQKNFHLFTQTVPLKKRKLRIISPISSQTSEKIGNNGH